MTIYLIKWITRDDNMPYQHACSSFSAAQKKVRELSSDPNVRLIRAEEDGLVHVVKPNTQADVINLINSL